MPGYLLYLLLGVLCVIFWRARAGRTFDQLLEAGEHHHHQVLAIGKKHSKGGDWADHIRWMAKQK